MNENLLNYENGISIRRKPLTKNSIHSHYENMLKYIAAYGFMFSIVLCYYAEYRYTERVVKSVVL